MLDSSPGSPLPPGSHPPIHRPFISSHGLVAGGGEDESDKDLWWYFQVLWRRKWIIFLCVVISVVIAVFQLRNSTPIYKATSTLRIDPSPASIVNFGGVEGKSAGSSEDLATHIEIIRSRDVVKMVIDSLGMNESHQRSAPANVSPWTRFIRLWNDFRGGISRMLVTFDPTGQGEHDPEDFRKLLADQRAIDGLRGRVAVSAIRGTRLVQITVYDAKPINAQRISNAFCEQYMKFVAQNRRTTAQNAMEWLETQTAESRARVEQAEKAITAFKGTGELDINVLEQNHEIAVGMLNAISSDIENARKSVSDIESQIRSLDTPDGRALVLASNSAYNTLLSQLKDRNLQMVALESRYTKEHPERKKLAEEIEALNANLKRAESTVLSELRGQLSLAKANLDKQLARRRTQEAEVEKLKNEMIAYRELQREAESSEQIYRSILDRSKEIDVTADIQMGNISIINRATIPLSPDSPQAFQTLLIFLAVGFGVGVVLAFLIQQMDKSIKNPAQVEVTLGLPTLGLIPFLVGKRRFSIWAKAPKGRQISLLTAMENNSIQSEAFRFLRTSLQYSAAGHPPQVILVTSSLPREGKSTISSNLAITFAARGQKTLLIDADLKKPVVHQTFGTSAWPGLSEILTGQESFADVVKPGPVPNLQILTAGRATPNPVELLESERMARLISELRPQYTTIIVDSAPLLNLADSLVLGRIVDGTCLVVNRGVTTMEALSKVVGSLNRLNIHLLGAVYNSQQRRISEMGDKYGYGGYYGNYGHNRKDDDEPSASGNREKATVTH